MIRDLFEEDVQDVRLAPGAMLLRGFAQRFAAPCVTALRRIVEVAPFRHMVTPGGHRMSVAMTNCGTAGWVTDRAGSRYDSHDPQPGRRWPATPGAFAGLAAQAAARAGFEGFGAWDEFSDITPRAIASASSQASTRRLHAQNGRLGITSEARWAVKDSNLGPAD
jgi:2OG-Fe(II) oxygenase superfamily